MGFLSKLFGGDPRKNNKRPETASDKVKFIEDNSKVDHTMPIKVAPSHQHYIIKSEGKYLIFDSKEDMAPSLRSQIESIENIDEITSKYTVVIDGKKTVYFHFNDIPKEIREAIEHSK